jgi:alpha-beta hydrolase superfamily lysophospholipase
LSRACAERDRPAIVFFNAGAVHHVGPNRVYVTLARHLSAAGFPCFRFDLEGIGDSVLRTPGRENHPYPDTATADARAALDHLRQRFGYTRFIALGLCSGAHTSFHAGLQLENDGIAELILINPLTFYWKEGMSLETTRRFEDAAAYKRSMRDPGRWLKLLRGDVNMKRLAEVVLDQAKAKLRVHEDARLSRDLEKLAMDRPLAFFIAEGDPGREILMAGARRTARRALRSGKMRLEMIPGADHTFSQFKPRRDLLDRLGAHLQRHARQHLA